MLELQIYLKVYYSCVENLECYGIIVIMRLLDSAIANDIVQSTILKLGGLGHATRKSFNYSEIEF